MVEHEGKVLFIPDVDLSSYGNSQGVRQKTILDRKLAKPGDILHVKGNHESTEKSRSRKCTFYASNLICLVS